MMMKVEVDNVGQSCVMHLLALIIKRIIQSKRYKEVLRALNMFSLVSWGLFSFV